MRVVLDTNVLVSATFWEKADFTVMRIVELGYIDLFLSHDIIKEYVKVMNSPYIQKKVDSKNLEVKQPANKIVAISFIIKPDKKLSVIIDDPDDNIILECAVKANADFIISKDKHLLKLKEFKGIKIVKPEHFLEMFL